MLETLDGRADSGGLGKRFPTWDLDEIDRALIFGLQKDGRASAAALARELGLDQRTVRRRVERLIDAEVIRIAAVTDPRQLGYHSRALVCVKTSGSTGHSRLYQEIAALPEVDYLTVTSGRFDFQAEVFCRDDAELNRVISEEFRGRPEVKSIEALYYLRLHYQNAWFGSIGDLYDTEGVRPFDLDEVGHRLVSLLVADGRLTFDALAQELGISETMVRKRYAALTRAGAMRVIAIANPLHLGYEATCWVAITCSSSGRLVEIAEELTRIDEVSYVAITAGSYDIITEVVCKTHEELLSLIDSQVRTIAGIERTEIWLYLSLEYKALLPLPSPDAGRRGR